MKTRFFVLIVVLLELTIKMTAQMTSSVVFSYDDDGNRTSVEYVIIRFQENTTDELSSDNMDEIGNVDISIYPNPTTGFIVLSVDSDDYTQIFNAKLMSFDGTTIAEKKVANNREEFNLTQVPAGIYFLSTDYNGEKQLWKIIKR